MQSSCLHLGIRVFVLYICIFVCLVYICVCLYSLSLQEFGEIKWIKNLLYRNSLSLSLSLRLLRYYWFRSNLVIILPKFRVLLLLLLLSVYSYGRAKLYCNLLTVWCHSYYNLSQNYWNSLLFSMIQRSTRVADVMIRNSDVLLIAPVLFNISPNHPVRSSSHCFRCSPCRRRSEQRSQYDTFLKRAVAWYVTEVFQLRLASCHAREMCAARSMLASVAVV